MRVRRTVLLLITGGTILLGLAACDSGDTDEGQPSPKSSQVHLAPADASVSAEVTVG